MRLKNGKHAYCTKKITYSHKIGSLIIKFEAKIYKDLKIFSIGQNVLT